MNDEKFGLSDELIANLVKVLQLSIICGVDIVDQLRLMRVENDGTGKLVLTETYSETFEKYVEKLLERVDEIKDEHDVLNQGKEFN